MEKGKETKGEKETEIVRLTETEGERQCKRQSRTRRVRQTEGSETQTFGGEPGREAQRGRRELRERRQL